jgi:hypothetical protein
MNEKRRASTYILPPIKQTREERGNGARPRRKSTSELNKRKSVDVEVRPIQDEPMIFNGVCGRVITDENGEPKFVLSREHEALERKVLKENSTTIATNRGPDVQSIMTTKPRGKMMMDLEAPVMNSFQSFLTFLDSHYTSYCYRFKARGS